MQIMRSCIQLNVISSETLLYGAGPAMARLLWMVEDLTYEEALRGTGWGRRRGWFRDALHKSTTLAQVSLPPIPPGSRTTDQGIRIEVITALRLIPQCPP